jgi:FkbH-like protein
MERIMRFVDLHWLPASAELNSELRRIAAVPQVAWPELIALANTRLDFVQTNRLDKALGKTLRAAPTDSTAWRSMKLALLSSSTVDHLLPALRVAALRRNLQLSVHAGEYGMYLQSLQDAGSDLFEFQPDVLLFAFHAQHLFGNANVALSPGDAEAVVEAALQRVRGLWLLARKHFKGQILQQSLLPLCLPLLGMNERRLPGSMAYLVERWNIRIAELAQSEQVDMLDLGRPLVRDGIYAWHDPVLWHRAKQEVSPLAAPAYGDLVLRLIAAQQGRSAKCLVLDLDNTLWGGVIGDDGLEGIKLGQGSAVGEAYVGFQSYVRDLARRGVILAVCSKNDIENARAPFEKHPEMILKMEDIACFIANWTDKATNLRTIAEQLNIGIDSLVFADDNPFERNIVRRELPMVAVPELSEDAALYADSIADAGYFEALQVTQEDFERGGQYRANIARETLRESHTDLEGYLRSLNMQLCWQPFDRMGLQRIVQLINKTNQFNLTTRRYTESDVTAIMNTPGSLTLQLRLLDQYGDNGVIGIVIGKPEDQGMRLDTWLMSCRVLGRQVEEATINLVVEQATLLGGGRLIGEYLPTKKNGMVRDHYQKLGFSCSHTAPGGETRWTLTLADYKPFPTFINIVRSVTGE